MKDRSQEKKPRLSLKRVRTAAKTDVRLKCECNAEAWWTFARALTCIRWAPKKVLLFCEDLSRRENRARRIRAPRDAPLRGMPMKCSVSTVNIFEIIKNKARFSGYRPGRSFLDRRALRTVLDPRTGLRAVSTAQRGMAH